MSKEAANILINARKKAGLTQADMADRLAETLSQTYSQRQYQKLEEGQFPKYKKEITKAVEQILGINIYGLIYEQNVPRETKNELTVSYIEQRRRKNNETKPQMVPFIPIKAQAGYVKAIDQEIYLDTLEKYALPPGVSGHGAIWRYWEVEGDSMEPVFREGDIVLTSYVHPMDWDNMKNFYVYVIVTEQRILIKRIYCKTHVEWVLISENEDDYPQKIIQVSDIKEVWIYRKTWATKAEPTKRFEIKV